LTHEKRKFVDRLLDHYVRGLIGSDAKRGDVAQDLGQVVHIFFRLSLPGGGAFNPEYPELE
jgi:hypothetical protein